MDTVFVGNLSYFCTQEHLVNLISPIAPIRSAAIVKNKEGVTCYYGFIYLEDEVDAAKVLDHFSGKKFMGRNLRIGIRSNEAARHVVDGSTVQMFVRFLSEKLEEDITEETLDNIFSSFGSIADCIVKEYTRFEATPPVQSGYAFLHVHNVDTAHNIMRRLNSESEKEIDGISFKISLSHQCTERLHGEPKAKQLRAENSDHSQSASPSMASPFFRANSGDGKYVKHQAGGKDGMSPNPGRHDKRNTGGRFGQQHKENTYGKVNQFTYHQQSSYPASRSENVVSHSHPPQSIPNLGNMYPPNVVVNGMPGYFSGMPQMFQTPANNGSAMQTISPMMVDAWQYGGNPHLVHSGGLHHSHGPPAGNGGFMMLPPNTTPISAPGMMVYNYSPPIASFTAESSPSAAPMGIPSNNQGPQINYIPYPSFEAMMMPMNQQQSTQLPPQVPSMQQQQPQQQYHPFQYPSTMPPSNTFTLPPNNQSPPMHAFQISDDSVNMSSRQFQQQHPNNMRTS